MPPSSAAKRLPSFLRPEFALALALLAALPLRGLPGFEQGESDLAPDPAAHFEVLPNGVRCVVLANREPRGRASFRLVVGAGSFNEKEDQRGLAHFLEHMAFKGSTHYPPGTLIERLQRMGMSFGADTNAETTFDRTEYLLELPDTRPATLEEGCRIFADYAGGLLLRQDQIDSERGVILSEKRDRDSVGFRSWVAELGFTLPETLIPKRVTIGLSEVIERAKRDRFADFYDAWYRPEKLTVIAVGDFEAAQVEAMISKAFGALAARAPARSDPDLGTVTAALGLRASFHPEPEAPATVVEISALVPYRHEPDTAAVQIRHLKRDLAFMMLSRRLEILSHGENAPFTDASASAAEEFNFVRQAALELTCKPENWKKALAVGEQELRRALSHGFEPAELAEAVANVRNELEQDAKGAPTRRSDKVAEEIADTIVNREVFTSPSQDLALLGPALDAVTPSDCLNALRQAWAGPGRDIFVSGNLALAQPDREITAAYEASAAVAVEPPARIATEAFPYADFGAFGMVASEKRIDDLGITEIVFANGVRLNLKKTDFEAHRIHVSARVGGGLLTAPAAAEPGIVQLASQTFTTGGLGKLGIDKLQRVLAGKPVGVEFKVSHDAFTLSGTTDGDHLLLELQLLTAYLTDPGYRPEALWKARKSFPEIYRELEHTPEGVLETHIDRLLADGDPRFGMPAESDLLARNLDEVKAWLSPQLAHGPVEIALVGDFDPKGAVEAVARTLGALPSRHPKPAYAAERKLAFPARPSEDRYAVPTEIPKGLLVFVWPTTDARDVAVARRLSMLGSIFSDRLRLKIRNEMSGAYSPEAGSEAETVFPGYGSIRAYVMVDPAMADRIAAAVLAVAADLQKNGVTADELARAKNPIMTSLRESSRTNDYWLEAVLFDAQEEPQRLNWARTRSEDFLRISEADVDALAARYLDPARAFRFVILPRSVPGKTGP